MLEREKLIFKRDFLNHYNLYPTYKLSDKITNTKIVIKEMNGYAGFCSYYEKIVTVNPKLDNATSIYHELMHSMSIKKYGSGYAGLTYYIKELGYGINEGYTQRLTEEFIKNNKSKTYPNEKNIALIIEKIIGKKLMQMLYFNAGYNGLIKMLSKYDTEEKIVKLIKIIDILSDCYYTIIFEDKYPKLLKLKIYLLEEKVYNELLYLYRNFINTKEIDKELEEKNIKELEEFMNKEVFMFYKKDSKIIKKVKK